MFEHEKENEVPLPVSGCGTCAVKTAGNCNSHLTPAVNIIAQAFIDAKILFDRSNVDHVEIVAAILAEDMRDGQQRHVAFEIPSEPETQDWFYNLITQRVNAGLKS